MDKLKHVKGASYWVDWSHLAQTVDCMHAK